MTTSMVAQIDSDFLDMQAAVGVTKHIGGYAATDELLSLCHVESAHAVLNVGCGIGVGSTYIARKYGCHVVGVDIAEKMIEWSRRRAREERAERQAEFCVADVLALPFAPERFDVVFAESVLVFVEDKVQAIQECVRVTKPGGYVGLNEGFWTQPPSPELAAQVKTAVGTHVPTLEDWQMLWACSGLQERVVRSFPIDANTEVRSRVQWIGWRWLIRAWGRALRLYIMNPAIRQAIKDQFDMPPEAFQYIGYGLLIGKK